MLCGQSLEQQNSPDLPRVQLKAASPTILVERVSFPSTFPHDPSIDICVGNGKYSNSWSTDDTWAEEFAPLSWAR